ncbi:MAG: hypothetical protein ACK2UR_14760 [Candidatus Promineifilaceae bacterium]
MNEQEVHRKCSAVNSDGSPCQAWAIRGSRPALCSAHAGRNYGAGARLGNKNALKHGYYTRHFTEQEIVEFEALTDRSLIGELVLARTMIGRLAAYANRKEVTLDDTVAIMPLILSGIRTIAHLASNMVGESSIDWDLVLDQLSEDLGMEL